MALIAYQSFFTVAMRAPKPPSFDDFAKSQFWGAFLRFARHMLDINAIRPTAFVDFLIRTEVPVDRWTSPVVYETYVRELSKTESPDAAVERNILLMQQWAMDTGEHWTDFFRKVAPPVAALWVRSGRISPWVLFVASSAKDMLTRLGPEQAQIVEKTIDVRFWEAKLERHKEEVARIRAILDEAGV